MNFQCHGKKTTFYAFILWAQIVLLLTYALFSIIAIVLGRSILSKVQKMFVPGCFPIHMDPRTSPSEKNLKKIDTSYWSKQAEVLLYDVVYSNFSPIT